MVQAAFLVSANFSGRSPLGTAGNSARPRIARRLPIAAAPALCGVAAAFALAGTPAASAAVTSAPAAKAVTQHVVATARETAARPEAAHAKLLSSARPAAKHAAPAAVKYTVKSGDTLSAIAQHFYSNPAYWPALYWANHSEVRYANEIQAGQVLDVPAKPSTIPSAPSVLAPAPAPAPVETSSVVEQSAPVEQAAPVEQSAPVESTASEAAPAATSDTSVSTAGDSSFQSCVIARESGGNSQVMNSSGHYGLYQFSASTWAEYGGNPADFGNASAAEQNQVFNTAVADGGASNWSAYDGC
jgi:LysM repeat protein